MALDDPCSPASFDARYRSDPDPWDFAGSAYELGRYQAIVDLLDRPTFEVAYEPACSIGVLTERLVPRCARLRAVDVSPTAVAAARERLGPQPTVDLDVASVEDDPLLPDPLELVVFSEVGYYFQVPRLAAVIGRLTSALRPGGTFVACHWTGRSEDHVLSGATVHAVLADESDLVADASVEHDGFLLGRWHRR